MEPECSLPHSRKPATSPYPQPDRVEKEVVWFISLNKKFSFTRTYLQYQYLLLTALSKYITAK
jgi:hypothetical protein